MASAHGKNRAYFRVFIALLLTGAFFLLQPLPSLGAGGVTGTLRGSVVDIQTNAPIGSVLITAVSGSGSYRATTDAHGFFALLQLPTDTYTVTASKNGYAAQVIQGITVLGDQSQS